MEGEGAKWKERRGIKKRREGGEGRGEVREGGEGRTVVREGDNRNIRCDGMSITLCTAINTHNPCYACVS